MKARSFYLLLAFLCVFYSSYSQPDSTEQCPLVREEFYYDTGWVVVRATTGDSLYVSYMEKGTGISFRYGLFYDCPLVFDEEYWHVLMWSIPFPADSFRYIFSAGQKPPVYIGYTRSTNRSYSAVIFFSGEIRGKRQGKSWFVNADLQVTSLLYGNRFTKTFIFSKEYKQRKRRGRSRN